MKSNNFGAAAVVLLFSLAPSVAHPGQKEMIPPPLGSRIPRWETPSLLKDRQAAGVLMAFAACVASRAPAKSAQLLRTVPESVEQRAAIRALIGNGESTCLQGARKMTMESDLFRGALAEAFLKRSGRLVLSVPEASKAQDFGEFADRLRAKDSDGLDEEDQALLVGRWLAHCLVQEHPEAVRLILVSQTSSREEGRALDVASGAFPLCLPKGQVLRVNRLSLRAVLAEAYYHRTMDTPD